MGKIAVELSAEQDKAIVIQQVNEMSETTDFTAVDVPKPLARFMIKNVPPDYLPEDGAENRAQKYPLIDD